MTGGTTQDLAVRLLACYERGMIVRAELIRSLVRLAADHPPSGIVPRLSAEILDWMRNESYAPPGSVADVPRYWHGGSWIGHRDQAAEERRERQIWYDGIRRWHDHFWSGA